jgi:hypothetical protein
MNNKKYFMDKADQSRKTQIISNILLLLVTFLLQLSLIGTANADFTNGDFQEKYSPGTTAHEPINGWTLAGYNFNGSTTIAFPTSISGINLGSATTPGGITDIYDVLNPSKPDDYFLFGATPKSTLLLPGFGSQSASVNLRSGHPPLTMAGLGDNTISIKPLPPWVLIPNQATSVSQQITIQPSDIGLTDGKVHVRFIVAPVLENPAHSINQQPFFAIQLNNITTGRIGANPLFFQWNYADQPGVPWKSLSTGAGINDGSNTSYLYTEWQSFDISPGNAFIHVGDTIEVVVIASGCSLGGHDGHIYVDNVQTSTPTNLFITATGPASTAPGTDITYTYSYTNGNSFPVNNVTVVANLPQGTPPLNGSGGLTPVTSAQNTAYVSNTNPTTGSCSGTAPVICSIGTLQPGQSGTFTITYHVPDSWVAFPDTTNTSGPINNGNYPISGDGVPDVLGPLVQTTLVESPQGAPSPALSNLVANTSGMPTTAVAGVPYRGSFTCANISTTIASGDAPNASCDITNLPPGLAVSQCTISPSGLVWTQPADIPVNQTVTCDVTGTPTTTGNFIATVTTNAANNSNSTGNTANAPIAVSSTSNGIPITATLNGKRVLNSAIACCGRPVILHNLAGPGRTKFKITARTGNVRCVIRRSGSKTYLKINNRKGCNGGSCTVVGTKNGITTLPLTVFPSCSH